MAPSTVESRNVTAVRSRTTSAGFGFEHLSNVPAQLRRVEGVELPGKRDDGAVRKRLDTRLRGRHGRNDAGERKTPGPRLSGGPGPEVQRSTTRSGPSWTTVSRR